MRKYAFLLAFYCLPMLATAQVCQPYQQPAHPNLGTNIDGVVDWSRTDAFVDLVRQSRGFTIYNNLGTVTALDAEGWPSTNFTLLLISFADNTSHIYNGTYKLSFTGQATVNYCCAVTSINNIIYDAASNTTTADVIVNATEPAGGNYMILNFANTRRTPGSPVNSGLTNVRVLRPGYPLTSTPTFTTPFLDQHQRFSTLRFMDWTCTNGSTVVNWNDRTSGNNPWQASPAGVSWEYCIELANTLHKDLWVNIPHQATNDYVTQLATLLRDRVDPSLNVYVEYSNEVWNGGFPQHIWNYNTAVAEVNAGGSNLNNDGETSTYMFAARRIGKRIKEISDLFAGVWGNEAINTRIRPVLAYQLSWPGQWAYPALSWLNATYGNPGNYLYGIAGAPYFNLFGGDNPGLTTDQVLALLRQSMEDYFATTPYHFNVMDAGSAAARWYGLKFMSYEGGPDTFGPENITAKRDASFDPRMETLCIDFLNRWYSYGGEGLFNWFVSGATNWDSQYGTWGLTNDMTNQNTPKIRALDNIVSAASPVLTAGFPLSTTTTAIVDARQMVNRNNLGGYPYNWATLNPYNRYLDGGSFDEYLIRVPTAGIYRLRVNLNCWRTGTNLVVAVNNQVIQTVVVPQTTSGADNFTDVGFVNLSLSEGLNVIRLTYAFTGRSYDVKELRFDFVSTCDPLPLQLLDFNARLTVNNEVDLLWKTANEINCESYIIEKSSDALHYEEVEKVWAKNSTYAEYNSKDDQPVTGVTYYRLRQIDMSGAYTYSPIRKVTLPPLELGNVYPVPANDLLNVQLISSEERTVDLSLIDVTGRILLHHTIELKTGSTVLALPVKELGTGWYVLQVSDINGKERQYKEIKIGN